MPVEVGGSSGDSEVTETNDYLTLPQFAEGTTVTQAWGAPGQQFIGTTTQNIGNTTPQFWPWNARADFVLENMSIEVTTGPVSNAQISLAIYKSTPTQQAVGPPVATGLIAVATSFTGMKTVTFTPEKALPAGNYITRIATDVQMGLRVWLAASSALRPTGTTTPFASSLQSTESFSTTPPDIPVRWSTLNFSATPGLRNLSMMGYRDARTNLLVWDGDSLTDGTGATADHELPRLVMTDLSYPFPEYRNFAVAGQSLTNIISDNATQVHPLKPLAPLRVYVCWGGTNDIANGATAATTQTRYTQVGQDAQSAGYLVVVGTCLPRNDSMAVAGSVHESRRQSFNTWLRANWQTFADYLVDFADVPLLDAAGAYNNATYYNVDLVHLTDAGYALAADKFLTGVNAVGIL